MKRVSAPLLLVLRLTMLFLALATPAFAVQPDEFWMAPCSRHERARSRRSCAASSVATNPSMIRMHRFARDLRILVRERLAAGDSETEVKQFLVDRYGQFVLLKPPLSVGNTWIYLFPGFAFFGGLCVVILYMRRQREAAPPALTPAEMAALELALKER